MRFLIGSAQRILGLIGAILVSASCLGGGGWAVLCAIAAASIAISLLLVRGPVEGVAASLAIALPYHIAFSGGHVFLLVVGSLVAVAASLESSLHVSWRPIVVGVGLAVYAGLYTYSLYIGIDRGVDLPPYTLAALSEPGARAGLAVLTGVYAVLISYYMAGHTRVLPKLLGPQGVIDEIRRRHRLAPLWAPILYLISNEPLVVFLALLLAVVAASIVVYTKTESLDAALAASYMVVAILHFAISP